MAARLDSKLTQLARYVLEPYELGAGQAYEIESLVTQLKAVIEGHLDSLGLEAK